MSENLGRTSTGYKIPRLAGDFSFTGKRVCKTIVLNISYNKTIITKDERYILFMIPSVVKI